MRGQVRWRARDAQLLGGSIDSEFVHLARTSGAVPRKCCGCSMRCRPMSCARATGRRAKSPSRRPEMKALESIPEAPPGYARDLQLNLGSVLTRAGAPGLSERQIWAVALAAASASRNAEFTRRLQAIAAQHLDA